MKKYIYDQDWWPNFTYDLTRILDNLLIVEESRGRLLGQLDAIEYQDRFPFGIEAVTEEIARSSAIEGENLDLQIVRNSVVQRLGTAEERRAKSDRYIDGLVEMAIDATTNHQLPLNSERLFQWHSQLFPTGRNLYGPIQVGRWRDDSVGPMVITSSVKGRETVHFHAPGSERLPKEMDQFFKWVESINEKSLVIKAGIAHLWFETLHPMDDGNGRIGRNIIELILARAEQREFRTYSLSSEIDANRNDYYTLLEQSQKGGQDCTEWLNWYLNCLQNAISKAGSTVSDAIFRTRYWQSIRDISLNERQRLVIERLMGGWNGRMTRERYVQLTKTSSPTATRDLANLVTKGVLVSDGQGGRSTGYVLRDFESNIDSV